MYCSRLFSLMLENVVRKLLINPGSVTLERMVQCVAYADNMGLLAVTERDLKAKCVMLEQEAEEVGLEIKK